VGIILGKHALERRIITLDGEHGIVDHLADGGLFSIGFKEGPAGFLGHPENIDSAVLVRVLRVSALVVLGLQFSLLLLKGIGNILEKD